MKKIIVSIILLANVMVSHAQEDTSLNARLAAFIRATEDFDMGKVMDYTYPKIFTLVPREQLEEAMKEGFDNEDVKIDIDSMKIEKIYGTIEHGGGFFTRVDYSMLMRVKPKNTGTDTTGNAEMIGLMKLAFMDEYAQSTVTYDSLLNEIHVFIKSPMVAVRDNYSAHWTFINLKQDDLTELILGRDIITRLSALRD